MAVVQSALLTFGTFVGVLWFFAQLPDVITKWQEKELPKARREPLILANFAHLVWMLYAIQKWDYDWFIPSLLQTIISLGHMALVFTLINVHVKLVVRYALAVPLVMLVLWRSAPLWLIGGLSVLLQVISDIFYLRLLSTGRSSVGSSENMKYSCVLRFVQYLIWTAFGHLRDDFYITSAFAVSCLMTAAEGIQQVLAAKRPKKSNKA